jgi:hypothetical protein
MATLHLEFNCLCLFVRDEKNKIVYVLMPTTHRGADRHVVRLYHPALPAPPEGKSMEGLEWVLGPATGSAELPSLGPTNDGTIVDVTVASEQPKGQNGKKAHKDLASTAHDDVLTRVTLRAGRVIGRASEAEWVLNGEKIDMAHRVVWEIDDVPDTLIWKELQKPDKFPLTSLADLGPEQPLPGGKMGHHLRIFHTTEDGLPPNDVGVLDEAAIQRHFRHFYDLLKHTPTNAQLPHTPPTLIKTFNCGVGQALLDV